MKKTDSPTARTGARSLRRASGVTGISALVVAVAPLALAPTAAASPPAFDLPQLPGSGDLPFPLPGKDALQAGPTFELSKSEGLQDGETLTIRGKGYRPGDGVYLTQTIEKPSSGFPSNYGEAVKVTPDDNGEFTAEMPVNTGFNDVDCRSTQCYVASFTAFPNLVDRSQDHWEPISFASDAKAPTPGQNPGGGHPGGSGQGGDGQGNGAGGTGGQGAPGGSGNGRGAAASGNGSATTASGATVTVSPYTDLNPDGDTVTVSGRGYKTSGPGIYVGIAQNNRFSSTSQDAFINAIFVRSSEMGADGSFSKSFPVKASGNGNDCLANQCSVFTFAAHGSSDRSQDAAVGVGFKGGVAPSAAAPAMSAGTGSGAGSTGGNYGGGNSITTATGSGSHGTSGSTGSGSGAGATATGATTRSGNLTVNLSTTTIAAEGVTPIIVTGTGFKTDGPGIYVGIAEKGKFSHVDASVFGGAVFVKSSEMGEGGSFSTTVNAEAVFPGGNCIDNQCALYTFAAHGSSDRSQDTATDITVAGTEAEKSAARERSEQLEAQEAEKSRDGTGGGNGGGDGSTGADVANAGSVSPLAAVSSGIIGAIVGGLLVGIGFAFGRRTGTADAGSRVDETYDDEHVDERR